MGAGARLPVSRGGWTRERERRPEGSAPRRRPSWAVIVVVAACGCLLGAGVAGAAAWKPFPSGPVPVLPAGSVTVPVGINFGAGGEAAMEQWPLGRRMATMETVARTGITWVRIDVPYRGPSGGWPTSPVIGAALAAGLHVDALLVDWSHDRRPRPATMASFARLAVARYSRWGVGTYEVLNEENMGANWGGSASAAGYAKVLDAAYRAVKEADPRAAVLVGGLASVASGTGDLDPLTFMRGLYRAGGAGHFDAVALHPYTFPDLPSVSDPANAFAQIPALRALMVRQGDSAMRIWVTEYGAPTTGSAGVGDAGQAIMIADALKLTRKWPWMGPFMIYDWQDDPVGGPFGLVTAGGRPRPARSMLARALSG
jgi:hypothetical protein